MGMKQALAVVLASGAAVPTATASDTPPSRPNVVVILANGGRIPVDLETARQVGVDVEALVNQVQAKHAPLTEDSYLPFLGDVIPVKYPFARIISVGDIFALIGAFLLIQDLMGKSIKIWRSEEARN